MTQIRGKLVSLMSLMHSELTPFHFLRTMAQYCFGFSPFSAMEPLFSLPDKDASLLFYLYIPLCVCIYIVIFLSHAQVIKGLPSICT